jgi:hypothetical protein
LSLEEEKKDEKPASKSKQATVASSHPAGSLQEVF